VTCFIDGGTNIKPEAKMASKKRLEVDQKAWMLTIPSKRVIKLRARYEWGPRKIAGCLRLKGYDIDNNQAYRIICQAGLNHPITEPRKTWGSKRFQREHCNSLWQADFKLCNDDYWMISYLDDRSRFITGSVKIWNPTGENLMLLLDRAVRR
jgi:transposase InsO family protein